MNTFDDLINNYTELRFVKERLGEINKYKLKSRTKTKRKFFYSSNFFLKERVVSACPSGLINLYSFFDDALVLSVVTKPLSPTAFLILFFNNIIESYFRFV